MSDQRQLTDALGGFLFRSLLPSVLRWHCHHDPAYRLLTKPLHRNHFAQSNGEWKTSGQERLLIFPSLMA